MMTKFSFVKTLFVLSAMLFVSASEAGVELEEQSIIAKKASESLLVDIVQLDSGRLVSVGERGHILISDDQGDSWKQIPVATETLLTKVYFLDKTTGWVVGHEQTILKTTDGGDSWAVQHNSSNLDQPAIFDLWFKDENYGIAVGAYGLYMETEDGGKNWKERYVESLEDEEIGFPHFYAIKQEPASKKLFMAGEMGFLAVSDDEGKSWTKLESPYDGSFFDMAISQGELFIMGLRGHLFRSSDLGVNWNAIKTNTVAGLQNMVRLRSNKLLVVGSDGVFLTSTDNGRTFDFHQREDRVHLSSATPTIDRKILAAGVNGVVKLDY